MFTNDFLNQISQYIQKNNRVKRFGGVIRSLVRLGNNDG